MKWTIFLFILICCSCASSEPPKQIKFALASAKGDFVLVKQLFEKGGIEIDAVNGKIGPALTSASYGGHKEIVEFLLNTGANINVRDDKGTTPLMNAVIGEKVEIVKLLLERGADPNLFVLSEKDDKTNITALTFANMKSNKKIIDLIEERIQQKREKPD